MDISDAGQSGLTLIEWRSLVFTLDPRIEQFLLSCSILIVLREASDLPHWFIEVDFVNLVHLGVDVWPSVLLSRSSIIPETEEARAQSAAEICTHM